MSVPLICLIIFVICLLIILSISKKQSKKTNAVAYEEVQDYIPLVLHEQAQIYQKAIEEEPEITRINELVNKYMITHDPFLLIEIGDIWKAGAYPRFKADREVASKYYQLASESANTDAAEIGKAKYIESIKESIPDIDNTGRRMHDIYSVAIAESARATNMADRQREIILNQQDVPIRAANAIRQRNNRPVPIRAANAIRQRTNHPVPIRVAIPQIPMLAQAANDDDHMVFLNDEQNVHDHSMNKITRNNIDKLRAMYGDAYHDHLRNPNNCKNALRDALLNNNDLDPHKKASVINVIDSFGDHQSQFECSELDSLFLANQYISNHPNKDDLYNNLFLQLQDCYQNGVISCTTGKISRVISVIGDLEGFENARNIYYIKDELERLASKVRTETLDSLPAEQVEAYNNGTDENDTVGEMMKKKYEEAVKDEYCDKLKIDYKIIEPFIETNMMGF